MSDGRRSYYSQEDDEGRADDATEKTNDMILQLAVRGVNNGDSTDIPARIHVNAAKPLTGTNRDNNINQKERHQERERDEIFAGDKENAKP